MNYPAVSVKLALNTLSSYLIMKKYILRLFIILLFVAWACDHGLAPPGETGPSKPTGISGIIYYQNWPPQDSVLNLKLVVFNDYPPGDIVTEVLNGNAKAYPEDLADRLPYGVDTTHYQMELAPRTYAYVVVAQQYGGNLYADWRAVGQYDATPQDSLPTSVTVIKDSVISGINIYVNFDSLPPQPF